MVKVDNTNNTVGATTFKELLEKYSFGYFFSEFNIGPKGIAEKYDISIGYVRRMIKEHTGKSYTQIVNSWKKDGVFGEGEDFDEECYLEVLNG